ncbi:transcription initiation factor TFIID subunit 8 [Ricinus communis]|uniref:Bromodomain associated domain-containing protein n=1 Tax=Ricinus communis TaxID=3988 RepID=B9SVX5_RICCO|nr:transcription initiation factor TFIID subunit 8 [Ricinus communis]EEF32236.1 conserved hypothetical protein [Ricinus communis]|eukprot:XP_002530144.1 transcription initiation factor TFIID subunit 8 [Ricinus communis]
MKPKSKQNIIETHSPKATDPSDFPFQITKISVSQICQSVGFKSTQLSALETLTHIATLYLKNLAKASASYSSASNRTQSNVFDIINALHDLSSIQGFTGASTLHYTSNILSSSRVVKDLSVFVNSIVEIPFAKPIPRVNPVPPRRSLGLESTSMQHIPKWLPRFPDEKACKKWERDTKRLREDLGLWENNCGGIGNGILLENMKEEEKKKKSHDDGDLVMERGRVRFKIGEVEKGGIVDIRVYKRNWASKGGKRVCL